MKSSLIRPIVLAAIFVGAFVLGTTSTDWFRENISADPFWTEAAAPKLSQDELSNIDIYERASPTTVNITSTVLQRNWFFEVYLRQPVLPRLAAIRQGNRLTLRWDSPVDGDFPMPVEVQLGSDVVRVDMDEGEAVLDVPAGVDPVIDPDNWILAEGA